MTPDSQQQFPPVRVTLKNGLSAVVRPLSPDDGEALADFYAAIPLDDQRFYCPHPLDREHALRNAAQAHSPLEVVLVLETAEVPFAGYAWFRWDSAEAQSSTFGICLRREFQGAGAGRAMMERLHEIARIIGPPVMSLTVQQANPHAVDLYRKMGFAVVREQMRKPVDFLGLDAEPEFCMERRVR